MRVSLIATDGEVLPLAGTFGVSERLHSGADGFRVEAQATQQSRATLRAPSSGLWDRENLVTTVSFSTRRVFGSHEEAFEFVCGHDNEFPRDGAVMFNATGGTRHLQDAVIRPPARRVEGPIAYLDYTATGTNVIVLTPAVVITYTPGAGIGFSAGGETPLPEDLATAQGDGLVYRLVNDGAEIWWEVGFLAPSNDLLGDAANGWTDAGGFLHLRFHRSENLTSWDNEFIPAPGTPVAMGGGDYMYYARSRFPQNSVVKSGQIRLSSGSYDGLPGSIGSDSRNNPFTAMTIGGVVQALGGFPYTMPGDAARMQADLRARGWSTATVTASSDTVWEIIVPGVSLTSYSQASRVSWPQYLVADMFGVVNTPVNGGDLAGEYVNAAGVRTAVLKQFARLGISNGPNNIY